ncbi:MAG: ATP-dependent zinc metalloprotease FtsH, partial [Actinomycetota bacterium]
KPAGAAGSPAGGGGGPRAGGRDVAKARTETAPREGLVERLRSRRGLAYLLACLAGLLVVYALVMAYLRPSTPGTEVSLDRLFRAAEEGRVQTARFLDEDARVTGRMFDTTVAEPFRYWTAYPRSDTVTSELFNRLISTEAQVPGTDGRLVDVPKDPALVTVDSQVSKSVMRFLAQFLFPLVILANLFALLFAAVRPAGGGGAEEFSQFGTIGDRRMRGRPPTSFADVAGAAEPLVELGEVRDYLADPAAFRRMGAVPPKGVLLVGPPGCGKTLLARAVAGEANASFYSISGSEFVESLVGVGAARVRDLFRQARASAPSIIFIDELDAVGRQRGAGLGGGHDEREQTLNELLVQMDGFSASEGVAVLAATNRSDILDPALLRRGRFDRHIVIERPDVDSRLAILRLHARGKKLADPGHDLGEVARRTPGFTGADLASLLNEAALLAVREGAPAVAYSHLEEAVERVVSGPRRKNILIAPEDKRRIAYHEAGHAVVASALGKAAAIDKLSVIARGRGIGHLAMLTDERLLPTREDMETQIAIAMAGIAAEELVLGQPSTGSEPDLERATNAARDMAGRFGMSSRLGRMRVLREQREVFLGRDYLQAKDVSQPTLEHLDAEVTRILDEQEALARSILESERKVLDVVASGLISYETVDGPPLRKVLASVRARRGPAGGPPAPPPPPPPPAPAAGGVVAGA